jgi:membrane protein DedA with SNARE-associated domain
VIESLGRLAAVPVGTLLAQQGAMPVDMATGPAGYPMLFALVFAGSLVPVVPTGALVSAMAAAAFHQHMPILPLAVVFVLGAAAAFLGDVTLYWLGRRGVGSKNGSKWLDRLHKRAAPERLDHAEEKLREHEIQVLIVSRLIPAGRIPVMLACLLAGMKLRTFVRGNFPACLAWALVYQVIGVAGGSLFPQPWEGVAAAVVLTLLVSAGQSLWHRMRGARGAEGESVAES